MISAEFIFYLTKEQKKTTEVSISVFWNQEIPTSAFIITSYLEPVGTKSSQIISTPNTWQYLAFSSTLHGHLQTWQHANSTADKYRTARKVFGALSLFLVWSKVKVILNLHLGNVKLSILYQVTDSY